MPARSNQLFIDPKPVTTTLSFTRPRRSWKAWFKTIHSWMATNGWRLPWSMCSCGINGHWITADSKAIYDYLIKLFEDRTFDMEHLVPWLQDIVRPRA